jgi:hypothetical protein
MRGIHLTLCTGCSFLGDQAARTWNWTPPFCDEFKNELDCPRCLRRVHMNKTLTLKAMLITRRITYCKIKQEWKCVYKRNIETRLRNHCCRGKALSITYSRCMSVALVIQHAKFLPHIILSSATCLAVPYFSTLYHKWLDFRGGRGITARKISVLIFSTTFIWNIPHSKENSGVDHKCV